MSQRVLVLYASTHGQTRRIAERVGTMLHAQGIVARVRDVRESAATLDLGEFDGAILGAPIHGGHHDPALLAFAAEHRTRLSAMPSAFFSVSLTAADDTDEARAAVRDRIDDVLDSTGWTPGTTVAFAGALSFKDYNLPERVLMRLIAHRHDPHIDVHEDVEYTDWAAVDRFAEAFAASLLPRKVPS